MVSKHFLPSHFSHEQHSSKNNKTHGMEGLLAQERWIRLAGTHRRLEKLSPLQHFPHPSIHLYRWPLQRSDVLPIFKKKTFLGWKGRQQHLWIECAQPNSPGREHVLPKFSSSFPTMTAFNKGVGVGKGFTHLFPTFCFPRLWLAPASEFRWDSLTPSPGWGAPLSVSRMACIVCYSDHSERVQQWVQTLQSDHPDFRSCLCHSLWEPGQVT